MTDDCLGQGLSEVIFEKFMNSGIDDELRDQVDQEFYDEGSYCCFHVSFPPCLQIILIISFFWLRHAQYTT